MTTTNTANAATNIAKTKSPAKGATGKAGSDPATDEKPKIDKHIGAPQGEVQADSGSDPGTSDIGKNDSKSLV